MVSGIREKGQPDFWAEMGLGTEAALKK